MKKVQTHIVVKEIDKPWLSNKEAIKYVGMSADFLERMRNEGQLPFSKIDGRAIFYKRRDLDDLMERHMVYRYPIRNSKNIQS